MAKGYFGSFALISLIRSDNVSGQSGSIQQ
jgi:hypothetical protein